MAFALTHTSDLDGVASAALLRRTFGIPLGNIFFSDYSAKLEIYLGEVEKRAKDGDVLFITDISPNPAFIDRIGRRFRALGRKGCTVVWLDHHAWPDDARRLAAMCGIAVFGENRFCATEIVADFLGRHDPYERKVCRMVHISDFAVRSARGSEAELAREYDLAIAYCNTFKDSAARLRRVCDEISSGRVSSAMVKRLGKEFVRENEEETERVIRGMRYIGNGIAIGFSKGNVYNNDALNRMFKESGKGIVMLVNLNRNKVSIRSESRDVSGLAQAMGGGGHPHAAGFELKRDASKEEERARLISEIGKRARALGLTD